MITHGSTPDQGKKIKEASTRRKRKTPRGQEFGGWDSGHGRGGVLRDLGRLKMGKDPTSANTQQ